MDVQPDFADLLALFNEHNVEYVIVGGYALAFYGAPRFTGDLDILVRPEPENAKRVVGALTAFGFGSLGLTAADFEEPEVVVQLGVPPVRIDLITSLSGVSCDEVFSRKTPGAYGGTPVHFISREHFVRNKRATARKKDLADLEMLGED